MFVTIVLLVIFVACFSSLMNLGLWSNTINLINVITAALLATNYFEPLAAWLEDQMGSLRYIHDFVALWLIFAVVFSLLRVATDYVSPVKVRFIMPLDRAGGVIMAIWVSWVLVCFSTMTLHTAPLAASFLRGGFQAQPNSKMFLRTAPDRKWLAWVHRESQGPFSRIHDTAPFDPAGDFILRYRTRRAEYEKHMTFTVPARGPQPPSLP